MKPQLPHTLASVDLGSNSFRLQVYQNDGAQPRVIDSIKEMVRLAAGLDARKNLDDASQERALACLSRFGERLRGLQNNQVRAVATNTFRVAKNINQFLPKAEAALGFPIEIIAGREEARLIYTGVIHTLPNNGEHRLVVDIGGGSTEFVTGHDLQPIDTESLPLGCVTYSVRFFQSSKITEKHFQTAITTARSEIQRISKQLKHTGWQVAIGTSGTAKAIRDVLQAGSGLNETITYAGMSKLMKRICEAGSTRKAKFEGLKPERIDVFAGGLAVMMAVFEELDIESMTITDAALRDGVLYDLIGRQLKEDMRDQTVAQFQQRYHVSASQAERVADTARFFFRSLTAHLPPHEAEYWLQYVVWAAQLHEIGIDIAHTAYHKHTAYILDQADMPGFSRKEQQLLSLLTLGQRGDTKKMVDLVGQRQMVWLAMFSLRLAALFCRARLPLTLPENLSLTFSEPEKTFTLTAPKNWLKDNPLTTGALATESEQWSKTPIQLRIQTA